MPHLNADGAYNLAIKFKKDEMLDAALIIIEEIATSGEFEISNLESRMFKAMEVSTFNREHWSQLEQDLKELGYKINTYPGDGPYSGETTTISWRK